MRQVLQDISEIRFNALAGYCRQPYALIAANEVRWLQAYNEDILIVVIRDVTDGDYSALLLAKDLKERYRWVGDTPFLDTVEAVVRAVPAAVEEIHANLDEERAQGDEKGKPVDFFTTIVAQEKIDPDFATISALEGYSPAVELMKPMMRWYEDADGNFVEQFQTTGFDTRLWELYLFAALVESGYTFDKTMPMPDFCARSAFAELCIEATTVNPSRDAAGAVVPAPDVETEEQFQAFDRHYMPIRYAGPLTAKLKKKYWEKEHVQGRPLVFAIQDFHAPGSMTVSSSALPIYLYGRYWNASHDAAGALVVEAMAIDQHVWGTKTVPSGFFALPGSENISAVLSNPSATISKFNRMGVLAGFGSKRVRMHRMGVATNNEANAAEPVEFSFDVNSPGYRESWIEGMDVYHNPKAKVPLHPMMLPGAAHHYLREDGQVESLIPKWHPMGSMTQIVIDEG